MQIYAAYGSVKDISVYASIGIKPQQIYTVGKHHPRKYTSQAQVSGVFRDTLWKRVPLALLGGVFLIRERSRTLSGAHSMKQHWRRTYVYQLPISNGRRVFGLNSGLPQGIHCFVEYLYSLCESVMFLSLSLFSFSFLKMVMLLISLLCPTNQDQQLEIPGWSSGGAVLASHRV